LRYLIFIVIGMVAGFVLARALYLRPGDDVDDGLGLPPGNGDEE